MLILSRKQGEAIFVGHDIRVTVMSLHDGRVRLGIEAPDEVAVARQELFSRDRPAAAGPERRSPRPPAGSGESRG